MSKVYETLKKKNDTSVEVYPNIERTNIPDGAINTAKVEDASITTNKIVDGAVTTAKINNGAVTESKLADGSVNTDKIADGNVTTDKLDDDAVTTAKINDGAVTNSKIASGTLNRCLYLFQNTSPSFYFIVDMISIYNTTNIDYIFQELYRQIGEQFPCCTVADVSLSGFNSNHGVFNGDYETIEFIDNLDETFNVDISNLTLVESKITSLF